MPLRVSITKYRTKCYSYTVYTNDTVGGGIREGLGVTAQLNVVRKKYRVLLEANLNGMQNDLLI